MIGLNALLANMDRIAGQIVASEEAGRVQAAEKIRSEWVSNIESEGLVLTGAYRDSVRIEVDGDEVAVMTDVDYSPILEFGDSRQSAHPVATRAFDEHHDEALDVIARHVEEVIR